VRVIESSPPYLVDLAVRLATGLESLPALERQTHLDFFKSQQRADGGFRGRGGKSDLYYTAFALRGLVVLGNDEMDVFDRAAQFLRDQRSRSVGVIDLISLVFAAQMIEGVLGESVFGNTEPPWQQATVAALEKLRRDDGGYAKSDEGHASSTYQTFLIALTYDLLELRLPDGDRVREFLLRQQRPDGGFVEIGVMRRSGTNPTAAAVGALRLLDRQLDAELRSRVAEFLLGNVTSEGGFRANTQIPIADLLSTFTAFQSLADVGALDQIDTAAASGYVHSLQQPSGGFLAAAWDDAVDVEYSFYGLGSLGLLSAGL